MAEISQFKDSGIHPLTLYSLGLLGPGLDYLAQVFLMESPSPPQNSRVLLVGERGSIGGQGPPIL